MFPDATVIGLANVPAKPPFNVALELPVLSPRVMAPVPEPPKALVLVVPLTVPALMVSPPVKVLAPESVSCEVAEFCTTPVTLVPMTAEMVTEPLPEPKLVIVPVLFTDAVESVRVNVLMPLSVKLFVPVTPPLNMAEVAEG